MKLSFRKAILLYTLIPIIVIFILFALENLHSVNLDTSQRIKQHMSDLAISYANIFDGFLLPIAGAAKTNAELMEIYPEINEDKIFSILELQVAQNPLIYGAAIAFMPHQYEKNRRLVAPYVYRKKGKLKRIDIGKSGYDYTDPEWDWWNNPVDTGKPGWTEPYFDEGAGNILMSTYAVPFYKNGKIWGVTTIDIPLHEISENIHIPGLESQETLVLSATGKIIVFPDKEEIGKSVYQVIEQKTKKAKQLLGDYAANELLEVKVKTLTMINAMLAEKTGDTHLPSLNISEDYWYYFAPIKSADWSFAIRARESEMFRSVRERFWYSLLFFGLLLVLIIIAVVVVSGKFSQALGWLIYRCQRIERLNFQPADENQFNIDELRQMSMTLNTMARALDSHFSVKESVRIAQAIRQQSIPADIPKLLGYQIAIFSCSEEDGCAEIHDVFKWKVPASSLQNAVTQSTEVVGMMLLDDANSGVDATVRNIQARAIYRTSVAQGGSLAATARRINDYLFSSSVLNGPVQAWFAVLDSQQGKLTSLNMGNHVVCHYIAADSTLQRLTVNPCPLASQKQLLDLSEPIIELAVGDIIIAASDRVVSALNKKRVQFGLHNLERLIQENSKENAGDVLGAIKHALLQYTASASVPIDYTIIVLKRCAEKDSGAINSL